MKQIKYLVLVCALFAAKTTFAQDSTYLANEYTKALAIYDRAQKYNDAELSKQALFELLVLNDRDSTILRTLAELYYNNRRFTSSALVGLDFLEKYPGNLVATEVVALSYEQLRLYDKAIEYYEPIWLKTDNINILYQIAFLQYSLKRYSEASNNLKIVDQRIKPEDKIQLTTSKGQVQEVFFKAALLNLQALIAVEQGNNDVAKTLLGEALKLSPEFEAAKLTLDGLNKG